jgi:hypothetical protein
MVQTLSFKGNLLASLVIVDLEKPIDTSQVCRDIGGIDSNRGVRGVSNFRGDKG